MEKTARILVTGGSGMVGRALIERLRREGYSTVAAPSSEALDLRDPDAAHRLFADKPVDYVFHLAGHIGGIGASVDLSGRVSLREPDDRDACHSCGARRQGRASWCS